MSKANLGWLFYKEMYRKGNNNTHIKQTLKKIMEVTTVNNEKSLIGGYGFDLTTTYPGLIVGSGYTHGLSSDEDTKMGFYFDHTTGYPVIPASSIKGILRSLFGLVQENKTDKYKDEKDEFIKDILKEIGIEKEIDVLALASEIFEGKREGEPLSIYERDIFYDATIVKCANDGLMLEDYITPHKDSLKEPEPIKIIKVAGGVTFRFDFEFQDGLISANEKEKLFIYLLLFHGVGAKINVGYGQFQEWTEEEWTNYNEQQVRRQKKADKKGLTGFELFLKELEGLKKKDNNMVKKIKEYDGEIEDIDKVKKIVESKEGLDKFHKRIMNYLDTL